MKKIKLYINGCKQHAYELAEATRLKLIENGYEIVDKAPDVIIGFGGDGTLLRLLKQNNYNLNANYIGVNCGTLGFMQDFDVNDVEEFVTNLPHYVETKLNFIELEVMSNGKRYSFKALNEFAIGEKEDKSFRTDLYIAEEFLEKFIGSGIIFATPTGSTALNLSAGGAILHPNIEAIQVTPREAISNSKTHCLSKSICVPKEFEIILKPNKNSNIKIHSDGELVYEGDYDSICIKYSCQGIFKLRDSRDSFIKTIRTKLI